MSKFEKDAGLASGRWVSLSVVGHENFPDVAVRGRGRLQGQAGQTDLHTSWKPKLSVGHKAPRIHVVINIAEIFHVDGHQTLGIMAAKKSKHMRCIPNDKTYLT